MTHTVKDDEKSTSAPKARSSKSYVVTAALVVVKSASGQNQNLPQGAPVPSGSDPDHLEHLLAVGLIAESK